MKLLVLFFYLFLNSANLHSQQKSENLHKRVVGFYKIEENTNLSKEEKINLLKSYIRPGNDNERMALFFYESWANSKKTSKKIKTKILNIEIIGEGSKALVTTEDKITLTTGIQNIIVSKAEWFKIDNIWYRGTEKSQLYVNGQRVR
ncbi:hypothetical protein [Cytophaga aurantiaca]|uniref:hypothetical protein n=1 Tax=Cytophaga aurantiaca TaxID=29530 RepID=UPI00036FDEA8|nr:hypothetical protein [Cytophaga aurantiaca]